MTCHSPGSTYADLSPLILNRREHYSSDGESVAVSCQHQGILGVFGDAASRGGNEGGKSVTRMGLTGLKAQQKT